MTTVLITGANRGLGHETARQLAAKGWTVLLGARDPERGRVAAEKLAAEGADVRPVPLDLTDDASVAAAVDLVAGWTDHLDVLVNNAGVIGSTTPPLETGPADFLACFGVNLLGPVRVTRAFLPLLRRAELPRVVMVSSGMGSLTVTTDPERLESTIVSLVYPSSKAALDMVTTQCAEALPGWKVNAVDPGHTTTDLDDHRGRKTVAEGPGPSSLWPASAPTAPPAASSTTPAPCPGDGGTLPAGLPALTGQPVPFRRGPRRRRPAPPRTAVRLGCRRSRGHRRFLSHAFSSLAPWPTAGSCAVPASSTSTSTATRRCTSRAGGCCCGA